ncbi:hypothetical protein D3C72_1689680 [compost metagenome]
MPWNLGYWFCLGLLSATVWACRRRIVRAPIEFSNDPPVGSPFLIFLWFLLFAGVGSLIPNVMGTPSYHPDSLNRHAQFSASLMAEALDLYGEENKGRFPEDAIQATAAIRQSNSERLSEYMMERIWTHQTPWGIPDRLGHACEHVKKASLPPPGQYTRLGNAVRRPHPQDCRDLGAILYEAASDRRTYRLYVIGQREGKAILFDRMDGPR